MPQLRLLKPGPDSLSALPKIALISISAKKPEETADLAVRWVNLLLRAPGVEARSAFEIAFGSIITRALRLRRRLVVGAND